MKRNHYVIYSGVGTYCPHIRYGKIEWIRNTDGNPMWGVNVEGIQQAKKLGEVIRIEAMEAEKEAG